MHLLCLLARITWKLQVMYGHSSCQMTALLSETFLVCFRVAWEIQLENYGPRHASIGRSLTQLYECVNCKLYIHILLFGAQLRMATKLTYLIWLHTTHQTTALLFYTMHRLIIPLVVETLGGSLATRDYLKGWCETAAHTYIANIGRLNSGTAFGTPSCKHYLTPFPALGYLAVEG